jgi:2-polyprenyl-6-methoxyphenol hydroxylase-like FAD-dependent oxidoreductase
MEPAHSSSLGEAVHDVQTRCCIAGGGPAGMMLGLLLARAGVDVVVLEKHADFLRDFRGDTMHPSTLEVMHELGLLEAFLARPHQEARRLSGCVAGTEVPVADFSHLPTRCRFLAFMPQWDFLDFLAEHARRYATFQVRMCTEVTDLLEDGNRIVGVRAMTPTGRLEVHADLTIGADGRHSTVRHQSGLPVNDLGAPIDVLWMRLARHATDPEQPLGYFSPGKVCVMIYREAYWQCGLVIPKGGYDAIRRLGLEALRQDIVTMVPFLRDRVAALQSWDDVKLLTVAVNRLRRWYCPGLLCIGDAAHAMSPIGGVGLNLAIQDAVATANLLARPLREGRLTTTDLRQVQHRRLLPTRLTQGVQVLMQNRVIRRVIGSREPLSLPWPLRLMRRWPRLQRFPARIIGLGFRPEHVHTTEVLATTASPPPPDRV